MKPLIPTSTLFIIMALICGCRPLSSQGQAQPQTFPTLPAARLSGQAITFPQDLEDSVTILIIVFEQSAQPLVDTWAEVILSEYLPKPGVGYFEVPMISGLYRPVSEQIDSGMRQGIPPQYHANTATFYGDRSPYLKALDMKLNSCYLFVLNRKGEIRCRIEGPRNAEKEQEFRQAIAQIP